MQRLPSQEDEERGTVWEGRSWGPHQERERSMWLLPSHWAHFGTQSSPPPNPLRTDALQPVPRGCGLGVVAEGSGGRFANGHRVKSEVFVCLQDGQVGDGRWSGRKGHTLMGSCDPSFWAPGRQSTSPWGYCHPSMLRPGCGGGGGEVGVPVESGHVTHKAMTNQQV